MSGSINFGKGPFARWSVMLHATWRDGQLAHTLVQITSPAGRGGMLGFAPGVDGFDQAAAAENGGPVEMAELLQWVIEATARALRQRTDVSAVHREHWQAIVDEADHSRAEFYARYPDGAVPAFEAFAVAVYDAVTGELVSA